MEVQFSLNIRRTQKQNDRRNLVRCYFYTSEQVLYYINVQVYFRLKQTFNVQCLKCLNSNILHIYICMCVIGAVIVIEGNRVKTVKILTFGERPIACKPTPVACGKLIPNYLRTAQVTVNDRDRNIVMLCTGMFFNRTRIMVSALVATIAR